MWSSILLLVIMHVGYRLLITSVWIYSLKHKPEANRYMSLRVSHQPFFVLKPHCPPKRQALYQICTSPRRRLDGSESFPLFQIHQRPDRFNNFVNSPNQDGKRNHNNLAGLPRSSPARCLHQDLPSPPHRRIPTLTPLRFG